MEIDPTKAPVYWRAFDHARRQAEQNQRSTGGEAPARHMGFFGIRPMPEPSEPPRPRAGDFPHFRG